MKNKIAIALAVLALGASAFVASAQDNNPPPPGGGPNGQGGPGGFGGPGGPGMRGGRPPMSPLMEVLDANHDGVIDAAEIANASAALKTLDKDGDGKLTQDELRPPRPMNGGPGGPGGPNGDPNGRPPGPPPGGPQGNGPGPNGPPPQQ